MGQQARGLEDDLEAVLMITTTVRWVTPRRPTRGPTLPASVKAAAYARPTSVPASPPTRQRPPVRGQEIYSAAKVRDILRW